MSGALDSLLDRARLSELLETLSSCLELPVRLLDGEGVEVDWVGEEPHYCEILKSHVFCDGECEKTRRQAGLRARELGESYIFSCRANLTCIAYPLLRRGELLGTVLTGPFLMDEPDSTLIIGLSEQFHLPHSVSLSLYDELKDFRVIAPARVRQISKLIDAVLSPLLPSERMLLLERQEKLYQQSRINESVQAFKEGELPQNDSYPFEMEQALLLKVKTADLPAAKAILNDLLGYVLFSEGGDIEAVKVRAVELCVLLSRVAMESCGDIGGLYALNRAYISRLSSLRVYDEVCFQLQEVVECFVSAATEYINPSGSAAITKAVAYIGRHYAEPLTLERLAAVAGLSPSYFSALFIKVMGHSFREQINRVRVEEAKRLLTATDYSLSQIAVAVGFSDQSSFSKVFKRVTGLTPNRYR